MTIPVAGLAVAALILALITLARSRGTDLTAWAVVLLALLSLVR